MNNNHMPPASPATLAPAVSVIVPVYKAEAYIRRCLDSLAAQTLTDFEVLLVDDGSLDGSGAICDEYAARDPRFRAFHKANGGVSSARQYGLDRARGEYVIHADPDDWVEPEMLEMLYRKAQAENADMVVCDYELITTQGVRVMSQKPSELTPAGMLCDLFRRENGSVWNKLVRRTCYSYVRFFPGIDKGEDVLACAQLLLNSVRCVAYVPKAFYHYDCAINSNSLTTDASRAMFDKRLAFLLKLRDLLPAQWAWGYYSLASRFVQDAYYCSAYSAKELRNLFKPYRFQLIRFARSKAFMPSIFLALYGFPWLARMLHKGITWPLHLLSRR